MSPPRRQRNHARRGAGSSGPAVDQLLFLIDTAYGQTSWHGPNLRGAIRGVTPAQAARRPRPGRHNIWELVIHAAYWKYAVWRRLTGATRGSFPQTGSNWFVRPAAAGGGRAASATRAWKADLALLERMHATLRAAAAELSDRDLSKKAGGVTRRALITGVAAHDVYHAGQIQLLKRLT